MNVLAAVSSLLIDEAPAPVTVETGGISKGDPNAGGDGIDDNYLRPITAADRVGAGLLTFLLVSGAVGMFGFMVWEE
jgi:mannan endo-1,6-alpha-mannosidase